eukprot:TRINITY_DN22428_c0_g1_i2.p1 TRINITY_DN22428_c0_g1~~TRINITY_DN22428_c0_g1_i2.p1  ORF type:complete len:234 (-),score=5.16 TRINITY_DN22428_c0_g1_i2:94-795(-)
MGPPKNRLYQNLGYVRCEPKWSFGSRRPDHREHLGYASPGPEGVVDKHNDSNGKFQRSPHYGFGTPGSLSARGVPRPGPGSYDCPTPDSYQKQKAPSWGFGGTTKRSAWADGSTPSPGPAMYLPKTAGGGAKYSLGCRRPGGGSRNNTPGPSEYKPEKNFGNSSPPFWGHPADTGRPRSASAGPGPGAYGGDDRVGRGGPKWSLGRRPKTVPPGTNPLSGDRRLGPPFTHFGY